MKYIVFIVVLLSVISCRSPFIDSSKYAVIEFDKKRDSARFDKNVEPASLSNGDISKIEELISEKVNEYNKDQEKYKDDYPYDNLIHNPKNYYKQLIPVANSKGEKIVWVNCLCTSGKSNKDIILIADGGSCFFQLTINLTKHIVSNFAVNAAE